MAGTVTHMPSCKAIRRAGIWHLDLGGQQAILAKGEWLIPMDRQPTVSATTILAYFFTSFISVVTYPFSLMTLEFFLSRVQSFSLQKV